MKTSRADNVIRHIEYSKDYRTRRNSDYKKEYELFTSNIQWKNTYDWGKDVGIQCNSKSVNDHISPRRTEIVYYGGFPKQVYAYSRARSSTNVGVGSVFQQKKKVRKIYLPETEDRGVGSSDLSSFIAERKCRIERETYIYPRKKTSSKCVGGSNDTVYQCTEKLSPISFYNNSKGNVTNVVKDKTASKDIGNNTMERNVANTTTQVEINNEIKQVSVKQIQVTKTSKDVDTTNNDTTGYTEKKFQESSSIHKSSDSLEQHVHNLEDPSYIQSTGSSDPMENKLEKEYRKIFSNKNNNNKEEKIITEKPMHDLKSTSLLRRRFEALKRGLAKKEDSKKNRTPSKESGQVIQNIDAPIHRDISIESDPPSLEARSYSHTKMFSPPPSMYKRDRRSRGSRYKSQSSKKGKDSPISRVKDKVEDTDGRKVEGMFKMWGEKFNFEDDKKPDPVVTFDTKEKVFEPKPKVNDPRTETEDKKEGKRFFFFNKKSKDKTKTPNDKKGVTTGRCEVKTCGILSRHKPQTGINYQEAPKKVFIKPDEDEILKKKWLRNFIQRTIESRKSLQIRWNNKMYTTSSSTVFELMDNMYRQANIVIQSQSETSTVTSSYQSYHKHRVNFVQDIEAWMVPTLIQHRNVPYFVHRNEGDNRIPDRKWFIDKSKAFAHEIELVLNSKKIVRCHRTFSSDYLRIDIPTGFFTDPSSESDKFATSNSEEVYKIIEYESPESELRYNLKDSTGDYSHNDIRIQRKVSVRDKNIDTRVIETVIKKPPVHRDVVIQGSNVHIPKRCDVIGVGIITHRVNRELGKALLNTEDEVTDEESDRLGNHIKQCQFAESYLREYYRHWMPLGMDLFPERASHFHVKCESQESMPSIHNQGDGTKSCPNITHDFHSNNKLDPTSNSHGSCKDIFMDKTKIFNTYKSIAPAEPTLDAKRVLPKDSFEVLRKRMLYACGNRSKWNGPNDEPYSVPSIEDKAEQDFDYTKKPEKPRKCCKKKVATIPKCDGPGCEDEPSPDGILSYSRKSSSSIAKRTILNEDENSEILPPPCKQHFAETKQPICGERSSSSSTGSKKQPSPPIKPMPDENLPCKRNAPCRETSRRSVNEHQCQCPCNPQRKPSRKPSTKSLSNEPNYKPIIKMPNLRELSGCCTQCKSKDIEERRSPPSCICSKTSNYLSGKSSMKIRTPPPSVQPRNRESPLPLPQFTRRSPCACSGCMKKSHSHDSIRSGTIQELPAISTQTIEGTDCAPQCKPPCHPPSNDPDEQEGESIHKLEGVHLKMKPAVKSSIPTNDEEEDSDDNEIKTEKQSCGTTCIGEEEVVIKVNKKSASCEVCSDGVNVKVQDEDGRTLYERRDYKRDHGTLAHRSSLLEDMYNVNRLSTASNDKLKDNLINPKSIANMIEISFGVKVTQGDKIAEIDLSGVNDVSSEGNETKSKDIKSQDVFIINSEADTTHDDPNDKNDINIKIVIKNFDTKSTKSSKKHHNDNFAKKISQKFHTVSTGYSDLLENHIDDMYSMHRTTIDLTDSKSQPLLDTTILDEKDEKDIKTPEKIQEIEKKLSKDTIMALASINDAKQRDHLMRNSKTFDVVNKSCHGVTEDMRKTISNDVLPSSTWKKCILRQIKEKEITKIGGDVESLENITVSKNVNESEFVVRKSNTDDKCYKTSNKSQVKQIKNSVSIKKSGIKELDLKNTEVVVVSGDKKDNEQETVEHLSNNEDTGNDGLMKDFESCVKTRTSHIATSGTQNDELSLGRKTLSNKDSDDDSLILIDKLSKSNTKEKPPTCDTPKLILVSRKQSHESKMHSMRGSNTTYKQIQSPEKQSQSPIKLRSGVPSAMKLHVINKNMVSDMLESILKNDKLRFVAGDVKSKYSVVKDTTEAIQNSENVKPFVSEQKITDSEGLDLQTSEHIKSDDFQQTKKVLSLPLLLEECNPIESENERLNRKIDYEKQRQTMEGDGYTDLESENEHTDLSQNLSIRLTQSDTDNVLDLNTSDDTNCWKPHTKADKKDMLKHVFEKATSENWKSKSRMKHLKNMLKSILTSDSSDVDDRVDTQLTSKKLVKDITYSGYEQPPLAKLTDSMNNYYLSENVERTDEEMTSDSSYRRNRHKCLCQSMAEKLRRRGEVLSGGCCCKDRVDTVHEQTSCNINNDRDFYMVNYRAAEHLDVHTQHSFINNEITNVMLVKKMESVMTSIRCSEFDKFKVNQTISPCVDSKTCQAKDVKTNTVFKALDDGKIVIRTADPNRASMKTEIIIDWKSKDKKRCKNRERKTCFSHPADILQCYETKKAVLEIYAEKTVTKDGERLVAKLPKFVYDKEHELENVKKILISHDRT